MSSTVRMLGLMLAFEVQIRNTRVYIFGNRNFCPPKEMLVTNGSCLFVNYTGLKKLQFFVGFMSRPDLFYTDDTRWLYPKSCF